MKKFIFNNGLIYFLLISIIVAGFIVRLYKINNPVADWHSWRQADTASVSWFYTKSGIDLLHPRYFDISKTQTGFENPQGLRLVEFPIFNVFHAFGYKFFPRITFDAWGRLIAIVFSLGSTLLLFFIGKRFLGNAGGLLSAFFFAFLPFNIYFSRVILPEPMTVFFTVAAIFFFMRWIDTEKWWDLLLSTIFLALAFLMKPYMMFYTLPLGYLVWSKFGVKNALLNGKLWIFALASLIPFFFWRAWMSGYIEGIPHWEWAFNGDGIRFKPAFWWWILEERIGRMILGTWSVLVFAFGFLFVPKDKNYRYFIHIIFASQLLYALTIATASVRHDYYQTLMVPAISLALAAGTLAIWSAKIGQKIIRLGLIFGCIILGFAFSFYQMKEDYKINHPEIITAGLAVQKLTSENALVIAPYNGDTAFLYQTKRSGWPFVTWPMDTMINRLGAQYYVSVNFDKQTQEVMQKYQVLEKTNEYVIVKLK